jgi:site-specific DNA-methyltransferase (adenine-specific)
MLDMLPMDWVADHEAASLWANKPARFLDTLTKSGAFLRDMTSRLYQGAAQQTPDL